MAHDHSHDGPEYYVEQLFTILVCGAFGLTAVLLYQTGKLGFILHPSFHLSVLVAGIAILLMVAVRAVSVWHEVGKRPIQAGGDAHHDHAHHDHHHDHAHGAACQHDHHHDHAHHDHGHAGGGADDHGHSHDLSWALVRVVVLFFPVALFLLGVPNSGFSQDRIDKLLGKDEALNTELAEVEKKGAAGQMTFNDLNDAAFDAGKREALQGRTVTVKGKFRRLGDKEFSLFRLKMTCCAADTIPLKVRIVTPQSVGGFAENDSVEVSGQLQFIKAPSGDRYLPVIRVADITHVKRTESLSDYE